eukprot:TRINITY_DN29907_c0_g1_i1.p1 TRINITY_DN29907_c0_g1~~TRINITY_DN29907_c0_g1_i1.p1  ORF type:complete len:1194 (+),score=256.58 TRINITY_DN29907_c0_g1_i1:300-3584(+)
MEKRLVLKVKGELEHDVAWVQVDDKDNPPGTGAADPEILDTLPMAFEHCTGEVLPVVQIPQERDLLAEADNKRRPGYDDMMDRKLDEARRLAERARQRQRQASEQPPPPQPPQPPVVDDPTPDSSSSAAAPMSTEGGPEDSPMEEGEAQSRQSGQQWHPQATLPLGGQPRAISGLSDAGRASPARAPSAYSRGHHGSPRSIAGVSQRGSVSRQTTPGYAPLIPPQSNASPSQARSTFNQSFFGSPQRVHQSPSRRSVAFDGVPNVSLYGGSRASTPVSACPDSLPRALGQKRRSLDPAMLAELHAQQQQMSRLEDLIVSNSERMLMRNQMLEDLALQPSQRSDAGFGNIQRQLDALQQGMAALQEQLATQQQYQEQLLLLQGSPPRSSPAGSPRPAGFDSRKSVATADREPSRRSAVAAHSPTAVGGHPAAAALPSEPGLSPTAGGSPPGHPQQLLLENRAASPHQQPQQQLPQLQQQPQQLQQHQQPQPSPAVQVRTADGAPIHVLPAGKYVGPFPVDQPTPHFSPPRAVARDMEGAPLLQQQPDGAPGATRVIEELLRHVRPPNSAGDSLTPVWSYAAGPAAATGPPDDDLPPPSTSEWAVGGGLDPSMSEWGASAFAPRSPAARVPRQPSLPAIRFHPQPGSVGGIAAPAQLLPPTTTFDEVLRRAQRTTLRAHIATAQAAAQSAPAGGSPARKPAEPAAPKQCGAAPEPNQPETPPGLPPAIAAGIPMAAARRGTAATTGTGSSLPPPYGLGKSDDDSASSQQPQPPAAEPRALLSVIDQDPSASVAALDDLVDGAEKLQQHISESQAEMTDYLSREIAKLGDLVQGGGFADALSPSSVDSGGDAPTPRADGGGGGGRRESAVTGSSSSLPGMYEITTDSRPVRTAPSTPTTARGTAPPTARHRDVADGTPVWQHFPPQQPPVASLEADLRRALSDVASAANALPCAQALHAASPDALVAVLRGFVPTMSDRQLRSRWASIVQRYADHAQQLRPSHPNHPAPLRAPPQSPAARAAHAWTPQQLHAARPQQARPQQPEKRWRVRTPKRRERSKSIDDSLPPTPPRRQERIWTPGGQFGRPLEPLRRTFDNI